MLPKIEDIVMALYEKFYVACTKKTKTTVSDGQGGETTTWVDSTTFNAAIVKNSSLQAVIAEKDGLTELYTITFPVATTISFHDVFKRNSDSQIFRVTSDYKDTQPPTMANFDFRQVTAEKWVLPT